MFQLPHLTASPFDNWEPTLLGGHVRITQFQPFLEPVQHYIGTGSPSSKSPSSKSPSSKLFDGTSKKGMEEIPLLCVSPSKPQRSWNPDSPGPEVRSRMQSFIEGQKKKREGVQYELCAGGMLAGGKLYHELSADAEIKLVQEKKTKKNADDEWESDAGSEFSVATGLDSVKFLADCGSFF